MGSSPDRVKAMTIKLVVAAYPLSAKHILLMLFLFNIVDVTMWYTVLGKTMRDWYCTIAKV